ncbi:hypothetical protein BC936DRAFT_139975 [Jimgerdemannia flammicorona]|uniref:C2H2-type domain-containing protein n=1 Tax=Jimgerdemannia flammicorona TaxID=994334 RepID=A0A433B8N6_9FUNG|nr:hypothetical protein BC936DRAFT_139975 [Jimgerdemannia flammicorona]
MRRGTKTGEDAHTTMNSWRWCVSSNDRSKFDDVNISSIWFDVVFVAFEQPLASYEISRISNMIKNKKKLAKQMHETTFPSRNVFVRERTCDICSFKFYDDTTFENHFAGPVHQKRLAIQQGRASVANGQAATVDLAREKVESAKQQAQPSEPILNEKITSDKAFVSVPTTPAPVMAVRLLPLPPPVITVRLPPLYLPLPGQAANPLDSITTAIIVPAAVPATKFVPPVTISPVTFPTTIAPSVKNPVFEPLASPNSPNSALLTPKSKTTPFKITSDKHSHQNADYNDTLPDSDKSMPIKWVRWIGPTPFAVQDDDMANPVLQNLEPEEWILEREE